MEETRQPTESPVRSITRRSFLKAAMGVSGAVLLTACGSNPAPSSPSAPAQGAAPAAGGAAAPAAASGGTITFAQKDPVQTLDPSNPGGTLTAQEIFRHIYDALMIFDENLQPQPNLAESYSVSSDGLEWTFKLRKGVKFQDGTPFNSAAVKSHFQRILDIKEASSIRSLYTGIEEMRTLDDSTITFRTKTPFGPFLNYMAHGGAHIVSPAAVQKWGADYPLHPVGTGPYKLEKFDVGQQVVLVRNDDYWKGRPNLDKLVFRTIPEDGARVAALETGEVDAMIPIPATDVPRLKQQKGLQIVSKPIITMVYIGFNLTKAPFDDLKVRQALSMAIDRKGIVDGILGGFATVADSPMGKGTFGYAPSPTYDYDPAKAKATLAEAGWKPNATGIMEKNGRPLKFTLWTPQDLYLKDVAIAQAAQDQMKAVGADVDIKKVEAANWFTTLKVPAQQAPYDMFMWSLTPSTGDGFQQLNELSMSDPDTSKPPMAWNLSHYNNPKVDDLIRQAGSTTDQEKRKAVLKEAQATIMQEAPLVFLYSLNYVYGNKDTVQGIKIIPTRFMDLRDAKVVKQ